jgi:hypothetical protein
MRFDDSPELFGCGCGGGTIGEIVCEFCGAVYNKGVGDDPPPDTESVTFTWFAGKQVCKCCFEKIENEVLRRISYILPWYRKIIEQKVNIGKEHIAALNAIESTATIAQQR